jgi:hypothetical protein
VAGLVALSMMSVGVPRASAHPGLPSSVFDPPVVDWTFVYDKSSSDFKIDFDRFKDQGMIPIDLEIEKKSSAGYASPFLMAGVFQRNTDNRAWAAWWGMSKATFQSKISQYGDQRMRLADIEVYQTGSGAAVQYAAIWVKDVEDLAGGFIYDTDLNGITEFLHHQVTVSHLVADIQEYSIPGCSKCFAGIGITAQFEGLQRRTHVNLTSTEFGNLFDQYKGNGFRVLEVHSVKHPTDPEQRYAATWVENRGRNWIEHRDMSATQFQQQHTAAVVAGYRPITFDVYWSATDNRPDYAMVWRQNIP